MKQLFITEVEQSLLSILDNAQMKSLHEALTHALWGKNIVAIDSAVEQPEAQSNAQLLEMFLSAKRVEGCSEKTLHYYQTTVAKLLKTLDKRVVHITTDDLRQYLRIISRSADAAAATSTTSAASFPVFWHGWRTKSRILWTLSKTDDIINVDFYAKESLI